ncbi:MAG: NAD(P)H-dependent flavin oxidoreductase, partial [Notoacmeibacter sp.]
GSIATGGSILAAQAMGADLAYIGTPFIATKEARAIDDYKNMLVESNAKDIVYSNYFTGIPGNYLKPSIAKAGMDPENLPVADPSKMNFDGASTGAKAWKDIWGAGQGLGVIKSVLPVAELVAKMSDEYQAAKNRLLVQA